MVRSPSGQSPERLFCVQCQPTLNAINSAYPTSTTSVSSDEFSRVSTPPTEVSDALSSPTFAPPPNAQELVRRRTQSDMASAEIGKRMLRGWAMLAEECPNAFCYGVPLVRPPKAGGEQDPRKECVVCRRVYIYERDAHGLDKLVPLEITNTASVSIPSRDVPSGTGITTPTSTLDPISRAAGHLAPGLHDPINQPRIVQSSTPPSTLVATLSESSKSLEQSLRVLGAQLNLLSHQTPIDYITVGQIAYSMEQVTKALSTVNILYSQEKSKHVNMQSRPQM